MKFQMNFTTSYDDVIRFSSAEELQQFYTEHRCTGLEVMPLGYSTKDAPDVYLSAEECPLIRPEDGDRGSLLLQWRLDSQ